jgi:hypothetical protein
VSDNTWQVGANSAVVLPTSGSSSVSVYPWFVNTAGKYVFFRFGCCIIFINFYLFIYGYIRNVYSPQLNNTRDLVIYYPPSYLENTLKV